MALRDTYSHKPFMRALREDIAGFGRLKKVHQDYLAEYIWNSDAWYRKHKHPDWPEYMTIGYRELNKKFGRGGFKAINTTMGIFDATDNWYSDSGMTRGYKLKPEVEAIRDKFYKPRKRPLTALITADGKELKSLLQAIDPKDSDGATRTAWRNVKLRTTVPVNVDGLRALYFNLQRIADPDITHDIFANDADLKNARRELAVIGRLLREANTKVAGHGNIIHRYIMRKSGRLYAKGASLQTTPRGIRAVALCGLYDYDFENCHYSIFSQMAASYGHETLAINHYLANKKAVRDQIAEDIDISIKQAKTCMLAIMYGAMPTAWHRNAIPKAIGKGKAAILNKHPLFMVIYQDVKAGTKAILDSYPTSRRTLRNAMDMRIRTDIPEKNRLAHLLQGVEARALEVVVELFQDEAVLLLHDGFVTTKKINRSQAEKAVHAATGYKLELSFRQIEIPADLSVIFQDDKPPETRATEGFQPILEAPSVS